ncbi:MAG: Bug family tripartite tricarboxylate transporter substrate binding protein [Burkholderiaceae bacterium]
MTRSIPPSTAPTATPAAAPRRTVLGAAAALALGAATGTARAQAWPAGKPIRMVLPSGAGGGADIFGRFMAEWMSKELGTNVIVDNKPGANGLLATQEVVRAAPDGYTLLISFTAATVANKLLMLKPPVDPLNDIVPIARIGGAGGNMIVVNPSVPVTNMKELVAYAKTRNDLSYASWGVGSGGHLVMESIKQQTGMSMVHVPYKTVAQIPPDVISGVMPIATIDAASPLPHIRSGRVRAIATMSGERLPQIKEIPTMLEQGLKLDAFPWYGLFGPKGLPREIVDRLNTSLNRWMVMPEVAEFFNSKQNTPPPRPISVAEFEKVIQADLVSWKGLIDVAGVKPE